jgi:hypothetical protein
MSSNSCFCISPVLYFNSITPKKNPQFQHIHCVLYSSQCPSVTYFNISILHLNSNIIIVIKILNVLYLGLLSHQGSYLDLLHRVFTVEGT